MSSPITELALIQLRALPDEDAAVALRCRLRELEASWKRSFIERGLILHEVKQRLLWRHLNDDATGQPYTSFDRWVMDSAPQSRSDCYAALRVVEELRDIPRQELQEMARCNLETLRSLSSAVRGVPEVILAAKTLSEKDFVRKLEREYPDQHIESRRMLHLNPVKSASEVINKAIKLAMEIECLTTREQVIEFWATEYLSEYSPEENHAETA